MFDFKVFFWCQYNALISSFTGVSYTCQSDQYLRKDFSKLTVFFDFFSESEDFKLPGTPFWVMNIDERTLHVMYVDQWRSTF